MAPVAEMHLRFSFVCGAPPPSHGRYGSSVRQAILLPLIPAQAGSWTLGLPPFPCRLLPFPPGRHPRLNLSSYPEHSLRHITDNQMYLLMAVVQRVYQEHEKKFFE